MLGFLRLLRLLRRHRHPRVLGCPLRWRNLLVWYRKSRQLQVFVMAFRRLHLWLRPVFGQSLYQEWFHYCQQLQLPSPRCRQFNLYLVGKLSPLVSGRSWT